MYILVTRHYKKNVSALERVQWRFTRMFPGIKHFRGERREWIAWFVFPEAEEVEGIIGNLSRHQRHLKPESIGLGYGVKGVDMLYERTLSPREWLESGMH